MAGWMAGPGMDAATELRGVLAGPVLDVAPRLLGALLHHDGVTVRLTEVEAYDGADDPGSHAYRGRTRRNATMFGPPGHLYCYFTYGMHVCCNVVCGVTDRASAVLLVRARCVEGVDRRANGARGRPTGTWRGGPRGCAGRWGSSSRTTAWTSRPARCGWSSAYPDSEVSTGPRVGLRGAPERPWRFWATGEPTVSAYRPAKRL